MRGLPAAACLLLCALAANAVLAAAPRVFDWDALQPPPIIALDNPFDRLSERQLDTARELVRARMLASLGVPLSEAGRMRQAELAQQLESQGVAVEPLLAQRDAIIEQRRRFAEAGVVALDGATVQLSGYLLPVGWQGERAHEFLLVAVPGACSHAQPPPPNQVVRVRLAQPLAVSTQYSAATVRGLLRIKPHSTHVFVIDGERAIASTYELERAAVTLQLSSR
jgi:hypothetical protein